MVLLNSYIYVCRFYLCKNDSFEINKGSVLICDHQVSWEDFGLFRSKCNRFILELKETLFVKRDKTSLNRHQYSLELLLFYPAILNNFSLNHFRYTYLFYIKIIWFLERLTIIVLFLLWSWCKLEDGDIALQGLVLRKKHTKWYVLSAIFYN